MADILRLVTLTAGGRPRVLLDFDDQSAIAIVRESFKVTPGAKEPAYSQSGRRYGGGHQVGETTANGSVQWANLVTGNTADEALATLEAMLAWAESIGTELLLEWRPDGASEATLYELRGTITWQPTYQWAQFAGNRSLVVELSAPVAPLAVGLPFDIGDPFAEDTRDDYTYDAGERANEEQAGEAMVCDGNASVEQRAIHTARGYEYVDNQQTIRGTPGATVTGWKNGVILKRTGPTTYLECYVDDEGTNSRLRIDKVIAGVRTNLASTNLAARVKNGAQHWVRGRIEGDLVTAEHFTGQPSPMAAPTTTTTHTLTAGEERKTFGSLTGGAPGRVWIPKTIGASVGEYAVEPFTYRNQTLPEVFTDIGRGVVGSAPALMDVEITPSGGADAPTWALLANTTVEKESDEAPFGIWDANLFTAEGWKAKAVAESYSANPLLATATHGTFYRAISPRFKPYLLPADAFSEQIAVEVWAAVFLDSTVVTPNLTLFAQPPEGTKYGAQQFSEEWGEAGREIPAPAAGTRQRRIVRLGTLRLTVDKLRHLETAIGVEGEVGEGSSGEWGIDYLMFVPAQTRACGPTGKPFDASYPRFVRDTVEIVKRIRSDLSARTSAPGGTPHTDHGLGGQQLTLAPSADSRLLVKLSSWVPDDPQAAFAPSEQVSHKATVHVAVTPRWYLTRTA